jgi:hypothetical protein
MRANKKRQFAQQQRKALEGKRSAESKTRKMKRKEKVKAERIARAIKRSPAGRQAAEALKEKRGITREKEQANYQKTRARASARMGGRRKQILAGFQDKLEE